MSEPRSYPEGVTSWIDVEHQDVDGARAFYGGLFGWTFTDATPPGRTRPLPRRPARRPRLRGPG